MSSPAKIDIIIPVYNTEKYIDKCLQSICNQTFQDWRGIIIDDKSTDSSLDICKKWQNKDARFEIISLDENHGISYIRNLALSHITAPYYTCIDSDDFVGENHIKIIYESLINSGADVAMSELTSTSIEGKIIKPNKCMKPGLVIKNPELFTLVMREKITSYMCKFTFKTEFIKKNNIKYWEHKSFEDHVFIPQAIEKANSMVNTGIADYYYRINPKGIVRSTQNDPAKKYIFFLAVCRRRDITENSSIISTYTKNALKVWFTKCVINTYNAYIKRVPESEEKTYYLKLIKKEMQSRNIKIVTKNLFFYNLGMSIKKRYYEKAMKLRFILGLK